MGCSELGAFYATRIAESTDTEVVCVGYSLAPEHPFPAAIVDGLTVLQEITRQHPGLPLLLSGESAGGGPSDQQFSYAAASTAADLYLQGISSDNPLASPLVADIEAFPPTLKSTGDIEVLVNDSRLFARKLARCDAQVTYREVPGMEHVAVVRDIDATGVRETARDIETFIADIVAGC